MERNGRGRHQYPAPPPPCGFVALSLTTEESRGKIYVFLRPYEVYIYIILSDCEENQFWDVFLTGQCQRQKSPFLEEDPKIVRNHW